MSALDNFNRFLEEFKKNSLWIAMAATVEDSPWHREANVGVHTKMLIEWYTSNILAHRTEQQRMLTLIACLMHDIGKPMAEITKFSEERGEYRAYHGHELMSARLWNDFALRNGEFVRELTGFTLADISNVALMIEHHVPFKMTNKHKRRSLKTAFIQRMGEDGHQAWIDLLLSDQNGRISDDQESKLAAVDVWMKEWEVV